MQPIVGLTLPYARYSFARALAGLASAGYRWVGFGLPHAGVPVPAEETAAEAERLRQLCQAHGLEPYLTYGTNVMSVGVEGACRHLDFVHALGARMVLWLGTWGYARFPDQPHPPERLAADHAVFVERLRQVAEHAGRLGLTITLKPHTGNTATGSILRRTVEEIGHPAVRACYDPGNVRFYEGISPEEDVEAVAPLTEALVLKDHRGGRAHADFPVPGEGEIDFPRIVARLRQAGFAGPLIVERVDGAQREPIPPEEIDSRLARARRFAEGLAESRGPGGSSSVANG